MKIKVGSSRCAFVFENITIKTPIFWRLSRFGLGIVENLKERYWFYDCKPYFRHDFSDGKRKSIPTIWGRLWQVRRKARVCLKEMFDGAKTLAFWVRFSVLWLAIGANMLYKKVFHGKAD